MNLNDAISERIDKLYKEKNMSRYALFIKSGVPQTTLTSIKKKRSKSCKVSTLYAICEGFDISLKEFFDDEIFKRDKLSD